MTTSAHPPRPGAFNRVLFHAAILAGLVVLGKPVISAAADSDLVLTINANASGAASIVVDGQERYRDSCFASFMARLVYAIDPQTGRYERKEEKFSMSVSGGGKEGLGTNSWTYNGRQPNPGSAGLAFDLQAGEAYIAVPRLDLFIDADQDLGGGDWARSACGLAQNNWEQQPDHGLITFPAGATKFSASGGGYGEYSQGLVKGTFGASYTLSRGGEPIEAVIIRPVNYETWLPQGSKDESLVGPDPLVVKVELRMPGTKVPPPGRTARFRFELFETTREPGLCLNVPPKGEAATSYDLQFLPGTGKKLSNEQQTLTTDWLAKEASAGIGCFDFGASGRLRVVAILDDEREIVAYVEGDTGQTSLAVPQDDNHNHIADYWEKRAGIYERNLAENWDEDDRPFSRSSEGDGISLFEDYRGFFFGTRHERLEPGFKHVFVYDRDGMVLETMKSGSGGINFPAASGCRVRLVTDRTWTGRGAYGDDKRIVNFNKGRGHVLDQRAIEVQIITEEDPWQPGDWYMIYLKAGGKDSHEREHNFGTAYPDYTAPSQPPESPMNYYVLEIYPAHINRSIPDVVAWNTQALAQFADIDKLPAADQAQRLKELAAEVESHIAANQEAYRERWWKHVSRTVVHEMGHGVGIDDLNPSLSGPMECVMRYLNREEIWQRADDRFELKRRSPWPYLFCDSAEGCKSGKSCRNQLRVSDKR